MFVPKIIKISKQLCNKYCCQKFAKNLCHQLQHNANENKGCNSVCGTSQIGDHYLNKTPFVIANEIASSAFKKVIF